MKMEDLIEQMVEKDAEALENFYIHYGSLLYQTANKVLNNQMDVEEIVDDVLEKIWNNAKKLSHLKNPAGYIITMTHNLAIDYYRKNLKHRKRHTHYDFELIQDEQPTFILNDVLAKLDNHQRTVLILKSIYDYSYEEISSLTSLSMKQVRLRYEKAVENFKKLYLEE